MLLGHVLKHLFTGNFWTLMLATLTLSSAFGLVVLTHEQRQAYAELEQLNIDRDALDVEERELTLEQRTLAEHSRLEEIAKQDLGMKTLDLRSERIVKQVKESD
jgi:cell division protein FtsL